MDSHVHSSLDNIERVPVAICKQAHVFRHTVRLNMSKICGKHELEPF